jgi:hypothetical protein
MPLGGTYAPAKHSKLFKSAQALLPHASATWDRAVVLSVARGIEPDPDVATEWFLNEPITEFGGKTACQLVEAGETDRLLDMLVAVRGGRRGQ